MPKLPSKAFETLKVAAKDRAAGINTESFVFYGLAGLMLL